MKAELLATTRFFDELSQKKSIIHSLHPAVKLVVTIAYCITVISLPKYSVFRLLPLWLYPFVCIPLAEIPVGTFVRKFGTFMPLIIGIGIMNPIFETRSAFVIFSIDVSYGWISFVSLVLKSILIILSSYILFASTGIVKIAYALRCFRVPQWFVLQLLLAYRYLSLFALEMSRMLTAHSLRAPGQKGIAVRVWGPMLGHMLLRSFDRAQRVYQSMTLRGFEGDYFPGETDTMTGRDIFFCVFWISFFVLTGIFDVSTVIGSLFTGGSYQPPLHRL